MYFSLENCVFCCFAVELRYLLPIFTLSFNNLFCVWFTKPPPEIIITPFGGFSPQQLTGDSKAGEALVIKFGSFERNQTAKVWGLELHLIDQEFVGYWT
ncbi:hypothetical protein MKW98_009948 [Papaver atlanticum]|uniref:Uncharacterized protein n=1 Tax=Papaver atlanticum TaxID=357466 RepID=A0AAD4T3C4_9MAGN|nr:hypothetical protein MKW98_009948 [Papaver atlanticum]